MKTPGPGRRGAASLLLTALLPTLYMLSDAGAGFGQEGTPGGFQALAAPLCTAIVNERDADVAMAGLVASTELLRRAVARGGPPPPSDAEEMMRALDAWAQDLRTGRDRLAELAPPEAQAASWEAVIAWGDASIARIEHRRDLLASGIWDEETVRSPGNAVAPPREALAELGFASRDCEVVFSAAGVPAEHRAFVTAAADACAAIVSRRRAGGFGDSPAILDAVVTAVSGRDVAASDALVAAVDEAVLEWQRTLDALGAVPTEDVPDAAAWADVLAAARDQVDGFARRAEALASGDAARIRAIFRPGAAFEHPGGADLTVLWLHERDCRAIRF